MRRHFPRLRESLLYRPILFQYTFEEKLSPEEHIELSVKAFRGLTEALELLKPYMEECQVIPIKFEFEGSITRFEMVRVRSPEKFMHDVHVGFFEAFRDEVITAEEVETYEPLVASSLAKVGSPELVPKELENLNAPRAIIAIVEESVHSDIDTTLHMGYKVFADMLKFRRLLDSTKVYSDFYGRNVNLYTKTSETASKYTRPHQTWIKIMPV